METTHGFAFGLGDRLRDRFTGFEGVCTGRRAGHVGGVNIYGLHPATLQEDLPHVSRWFAEPHLALVEPQAVPR